MAKEINFVFDGDSSGSVCVQFRDGETGTGGVAAIAVVVSRDYGKTLLASTGMDAPMAAQVEMIVGLGTAALLGLYRDGRAVGELSLRCAEGRYFIFVSLPEVEGSWKITDEDFADLCCMFNGAAEA